MGTVRRVALLIAVVVVIPACGQTSTTPPAPAPSDPAGLNGTPLFTTRAKLDWTNGPLTQTSVSIERSSDDVTFVQVAVVAGTAVTYTDLTLLPSTTYFYRVRAINETTPSANYSNVASVTTGTPAWSPVSPSGTPPTGRINMGATNAVVGNQMIICAGDDSSTPLPTNNQTWALQYSGAGAPAWTQQATGTNPGVRSSPGVAYNPSTQEVILFGGYDGFNSIYRNDVWKLTQTSPGVWNWSSVVVAGTAPSGRLGHAVVIRGSKLYVVGGFDQNGNFLNDVSTLDFSSPTPVWSNVFISGPVAPRAFHTAVYDSANDQIVVFGGTDGVNFRNDTWALKLSGSPFWSLISSSSVPPAGRSNTSAVYCSSAQAMIVFGGSSASACLNDVWMLTLSGLPAWSPVLVTGAPPSIRSGHVAIFDEVTQRMLIFGGQNVFQFAPPPPLLFDVLQLQF